MSDIVSSKLVGTMRDLREHRIPSLAFKDYTDRLRAKWGDKFSEAGLSDKFRPFFRTGTRIKVRFSCGTVKTGTVGGTTGWQPSLMLMLRSTSSGSSWLLSDRDEVIGIQRPGRHGYRET